MSERAAIYPLDVDSQRPCFMCPDRAVVVAFGAELSVLACPDHGRAAQDKASAHTGELAQRWGR